MDNEKNSTHFGYREVPAQEKANLVAAVFRSVAPKYDLMNDLMSLGLHRLWKRATIHAAQVRPGYKILDVAAGTGDLTKAFAQLVGQDGKIIMTDINDAMLSVGRDRLLNHSITQQVDYVQADAERLPFVDNYFDCITIAFGLRNVTHKAAALQEMYRILKPGGKLLILEFSHPYGNLLKKVYDFYSFNIIPRLGAYIANDKESYQYLVESIRMHPDQETLKNMLHDAQFEDCQYENFNGGIVALHKGYKY